MTPRPGLLRGSKIKNYKGSNALRVTWSPPPGFSTDYLPLEQLEQYLLGVFYASEFNRLIGKKSA